MKTAIFLSCTAAFLPLIKAQYIVPPPSTAPDDTTHDCTGWVVVFSGESCDDITLMNGIMPDDFEAYNPSVGADCNLIDGGSYCIQVNFGLPPDTSTPTTTAVITPPSSTPGTITATTTAGNDISTPTPHQTGMINICNKFHLVKSGDTCEAIISDYNISPPGLFVVMNPAVGLQCTALSVSNYVCVGILSETTAPTTTSISTPTPHQTGMISICNKFHLVKSGDTCEAILSDYGISLAMFYVWNLAVGSQCTTLWVGNYVCVGITGQTAAPTTTGNGISTPTPHQTGMTGSCDKFYLVKPGDTCAAIISDYGISLATFYAWNPAVGSQCTSLWLSNYVCVHSIGSTPSRTTTSGNGIKTPTPFEPGMVGNCNKFYLVKSGDTCDKIASSQKVSVANIEKWNTQVGGSCTGLWANAYICVGVK